ncbi:MAG: TSUP family transporter [Chloroherpetonaceae bacterium]|nr:TSUP family transporter [Chloroherpetonaceae bacterium]MCS7210851.1 TSUP family transporter [Chloroherpetonaceae bacterium]MDW8018462.1 TSUP family transporter [Chloroherpetonaceae bacterium]MDW8466403.1 TSUP family transporter [Chloroherpetonaceae bacterium]
MEFSPELLWACAAAFIAGFIDAIVGGGGLVQLPALFIVLPPETDVPPILGTNKLSSICGTSIATVRYARSLLLNWRVALAAAVPAFFFSALGASTVSLFRKETLRPVILLLLLTVAFYTLAHKNFGDAHRPKLSPQKELFYAALVGLVLGFYDGFFGPGTGSFLIFLFISIFGFDFLHASATAKVVNFSTNLAAVLYFGLHGHVLYLIGLPMGVSNILGALLGTRLAMLRGSAFIRTLFLLVIFVIIAKFGYDTLQSTP